MILKTSSNPIFAGGAREQLRSSNSYFHAFSVGVVVAKGKNAVQCNVLLPKLSGTLRTFRDTD